MRKEGWTSIGGSERREAKGKKELKKEAIERKESQKEYRERRGS